jgi:hypothetical protein
VEVIIGILSGRDITLASQWQRLLKNQGTWIGSFTQLSSTGEIVRDTPTEVALKPIKQGEAMRQEIRKMPPAQPVDETVLEYRSLGKGVLFCEDGAFSQGSIQWSPVSEFGAELGLLHQTERLRIVQIFSRQPTLSSLTLIREHLAGTTPVERPGLTANQLFGTWQGHAVTVYPDLQPQQEMTSQLVIRQISEECIEQQLTFQGGPSIQTQGRIAGSQIQFEQGSQPVTVLLLPNGASATFPTHIQPGRPLFLEAGWLFTPDLRQRLIRTYDQRGTWVSLTLVTEQRV